MTVDFYAICRNFLLTNQIRQTIYTYTLNSIYVQVEIFEKVFNRKYIHIPESLLPDMQKPILLLYLLHRTSLPAVS